ncbi:1795_t:CDS:2 [Paraglomus occultum]|uniref:1795_t:CDS:1 n=1 Tax=Paraglomus occultum TaxID=144539 RepID=A0A9N9BYR4_9GLOM|nr:1795_t:CDS:2 [Paraglomus occultum]
MAERGKANQNLNLQSQSPIIKRHSHQSIGQCLTHISSPNELTFTFNPPHHLNQTTPATTKFLVNYLPLLQNPPLHLAILVAADSDFVIDAPTEKRKSGDAGLESVKEKLRCAGYLWQAFTAEQMHRNGFGRRVFRLYEEWQPDTMSNQETSLRETAKIYIIRTKYTKEELLDPDRAQQYKRPPGTPNPKKKDLFAIFMEALRDYGPPFDRQCYVAGLILDSHYDPAMDLIRGHAALGGGADHIRLGIFGSHLTHAWPRCLEQVVSCFQDDTNITQDLANDNGESYTWWKCCNIGIGAMLHEVGHALTLPHSKSGIMSRGYNNLNRTFTVKEPHRNTPVLPQDENGAHWHRCDVMRLRFHPCFRLATDPSNDHDYKHAYPTFWPVDDSVLVKCMAGISLIEVKLDDQFQTHFEFPDEQPHEWRLQIDHIKKQVGWKNGQRLDIAIITTGQEEHTLVDAHSFLETHRNLYPDIGLALKSGTLGSSGGSKFEVIFPKSNAHVSKVRINSGIFLDGLKFYWSNKKNVSIGGKGGSASKFELTKREKLVSLMVKAGIYVDGIEFKTNLGRTSGWRGGMGGCELTVLSAPEGHEMVGIHGTAGSLIDSIGIIYRPVQH